MKKVENFEEIKSSLVTISQLDELLMINFFDQKKIIDKQIYDLREEIEVILNKKFQILKEVPNSRDYVKTVEYNKF